MKKIIKRFKYKDKLKKLITKRKSTVKRHKEQIKKKKNLKNSFWKKFFLFIFVLFFLTAGGFLIWVSRLEIPTIKSESLKMSQATKIYDRTGKNILYNIYEDEKRTVIPISKISKYIQWASVAIEDKNFYYHDGTELYHLLGSIYDYLFNGKKLRGASTITQQVIKQTILTPERKLSRKVKEWILSWKLENVKKEQLGSKKAAKDSILEMYLNQNPYGGTIYGVEEASMFYFGKHASDVTVAEAAYLAAMPQAPSTYSPYGKHRTKLDARKNAVLKAMYDQGYIDITKYEEAKDENVKFVFRKKDSGIRAPHFVMYVKKLLTEIYDEETIKSGGLRVYTSIDLDLQEKIQKIVENNIIKAKEQKLGVSNGAVVLLNPSNGEILTMVGSKNYFAEDIDGKYNVATAKRQPGSTFKPFAYLTAFQKGYTPKTILWDVKTEFSNYCDPNYLRNGKKSTRYCYHPNDYDFKFKGPMRMEQALPESRNVPAVKTLYLAGLKDTFKNIKLMGIKSLNFPAEHYGMSLVLGAGEVQLLNLTSAYGVLANNGKRFEPKAILRIEDPDGNVIYKPKTKSETILKKEIALMMSNILANNKLKYPTFGLNSPLYFKDREVASKTGTTNDDKDFWVIGYNPGDIAGGVWVGNNDNTPAKGKANRYAKKIWRESMELALANVPKKKFKKIKIDYSNLKPVLRGVWQGNKMVKIDLTTGTVATEDTPEEFIKEIPIPEYHSILHWVTPNNPRGPIPKKKDRAYERWEYGVHNWIEHNFNKIAGDVRKNINELIQSGALNLTIDPVTGKPIPVKINFNILTPENDTNYTKNSILKLRLNDPEKKVLKYLIYINGQYFDATIDGIDIYLNSINNLRDGQNILSIKAVGENNQILEKSIRFNILSPEEILRIEEIKAKEKREKQRNESKNYNNNQNNYSQYSQKNNQTNWDNHYFNNSNIDSNTTSTPPPSEENQNSENNRSDNSENNENENNDTNSNNNENESNNN